MKEQAELVFKNHLIYEKLKLLQFLKHSTLFFLIGLIGTIIWMQYKHDGKVPTSYINFISTFFLYFKVLGALVTPTPSHRLCECIYLCMYVCV